jgi:hypothetical protein
MPATTKIVATRSSGSEPSSTFAVMEPVTGFSVLDVEKAVMRE